jgi:putative phosphoesterase
MRIAILSDIHGNLTALEAIITDLRQTAPDLILHGGDLADSGSSPVEVLDRIRGLNWPGVLGNTDEMLFRPQSLEHFASQSTAPASMWAAIREIAAATRAALGAARLAWLSQLPMRQIHAPIGLVHASPESCWHAPAPSTSDTGLQSLYAPLAQPILVYGHTHIPSIRELPGLTLVNSGSVGLPYDGDPRASYALIDEETASIRRVEYDLERELNALKSSSNPSAQWTAKMLQSASPQLP